MTVIAPTTPVERAVLWQKVDRDFWVGNQKGTFLGTIERNAAGEYIARDSVAAEVGVYRSLHDARAAVTVRSRSED